MSTPVRKQWLDRLLEAIQQDDPPYIESLGDHWGELCATQELALDWSDQLLPTLQNVLRERASGTFAFFSGTSLCYSALFKAGRHDQILQLLSTDRHPIWPYLIWGAKVLAARGQIDEAIAYARDRAGSTNSEETLARFAEDLLLKAGRRAEAIDQYALQANQANTHQPLRCNAPWPPYIGCRPATLTNSPVWPCRKPIASPSTQPPKPSRPNRHKPHRTSARSRQANGSLDEAITGRGAVAR